MPFSRLADRIIAAAPQLRGREGGRGLGGSVAGLGALGVIGSLMNSDEG
jgi:hypothetical protein